MTTEEIKQIFDEAGYSWEVWKENKAKEREEAKEEVVVYTVGEIADLLKVQKNTIRDALKAGDMRGFKVGNRWRVSEEQLKEYMEDITPREDDEENNV